MSRPSDPRQISLLPPDAAAIIHLVRENLRVLRELVQRHEIPWLDADGEGVTIRSPADVAAYLGPEMAELGQEQLRVVLLNTKNRVVGAVLVYQGTIDSICVRPADCFREAVRVGAASIVLLHNHPSTDPTPSPEDVRLTRDVGQVGRLLGIELLDHLVIGGERHVSLRERGLYAPPPVTSTVTPEWNGIRRDSGKRARSVGECGDTRADCVPGDHNPPPRSVRRRLRREAHALTPPHRPGQKVSVPELRWIKHSLE